MNIGLIIAAGKQSRFKQQLPKCLASINGTCILDTTIASMKQFFDDVIVVCSKENEHYFKNYKYISINSGLGSGDAILKAIQHLLLKHTITKNDNVVIQWGDALVDIRLYHKLMLSNPNNECIIPCTIEDNPYVQLVDINGKVSVKFSKYNDKITSGYHDMCVFYSNILYLFNYLSEFYNKYFTVDYYNHSHGNEFEFLDVFNDTDCKATILEVDNSYTTLSFNTIEELNNLGGTINGN